MGLWRGDTIASVVQRGDEPFSLTNGGPRRQLGCVFFCRAAAVASCHIQLSRDAQLACVFQLQPLVARATRCQISPLPLPRVPLALCPNLSTCAQSRT